ncbi:hypothetical protein [Alloyangia mangrovi]|uniref:hypothetical protein n=1 Tax=Alloyangia mangrovi TaxID=1779329 RepID=UPI0021A57DFC|nr:hypothetical protein [Alloyangia mangrovi]
MASGGDRGQRHAGRLVGDDGQPHHFGLRKQRARLRQQGSRREYDVEILRRGVGDLVDQHRLDAVAGREMRAHICGIGAGGLGEIAQHENPHGAGVARAVHADARGEVGPVDAAVAGEGNEVGDRPLERVELLGVRDRRIGADEGAGADPPLDMPRRLQRGVDIAHCDR